jgi:hypothetical protein
MGIDQGAGNNNTVRPSYRLRVYPSFTTGIWEEGAINNELSTRLEDLAFDYDVLNGGTLSNTVYTKHGTGCTTFPRPTTPGCGVLFYATTRFRKTAWDGATPPVVNTSTYNIAYKAAAGILPNFDPTYENNIAADALTYWQGKWTGSDQCLNPDSHGTITQAFTAVGGRWDLGPVTHVHGLALFQPITSSSPSFRDVALGESECAMNFPNHLIETRAGSNLFCGYTCTGANATAQAFGRYVSGENRTTFYTGVYGTTWNFSAPSTITADRVTPIYMARTDVVNGYHLDGAHHPELWYDSYLISDGDKFYYNGIIQWVMYAAQEFPAGVLSYTHHGNWLSQSYRTFQPRGYAWYTRTLGGLMTIIDPNDPTYQMMQQHWIINAKVGEGGYNITNGNYPPNDATCAGFNPNTSNDALGNQDAWCWGAVVLQGDQSQALGSNLVTDGGNPFGWPGKRANNKATQLPINYGPSGGAVVAITAAFMQHYKELVNYWNMHRELGYESAIHKKEAQAEISAWNSPNHQKWLMAEEEMPMLIDNGVNGPGQGTSADLTLPAKIIRTTAEWRAAWLNGFVTPNANCATVPPNQPFNFDTYTYWRCTGYYAYNGSEHTFETYAPISRATVSGWVDYTTIAMDGITTLSGLDLWNWINGPGVVPNTHYNEDIRYNILPYSNGTITLTASPSSMSFNCTITGSNPAGQTLTIGASGVTLDNWSTSDTTTWLSQTPSSGVAAGNTTVNVDCTGLAAGSFNDNVVIASTTTGILGPISVPVALTVYDAPNITTLSLPVAKIGSAYSTTLAATGGRPSLTWSVVSGALPTGLSMNSAGVISGTPTVGGNYGFTVQVTDANSVSDTQALSLGVGGTPGVSYSNTVTLSK